uniref:Uncharacterized protein n=1 Tax=Anguilla anguilla TaxID=7936 RepID=A0A0E9X7S8_ANGAN
MCFHKLIQKKDKTFKTVVKLINFFLVFVWLQTSLLIKPVLLILSLRLARDASVKMLTKKKAQPVMGVQPLHV